MGWPKILVSAPVPLELIWLGLTGLGLGLGGLGFGTGLDNKKEDEVPFKTTIYCQAGQAMVKLKNTFWVKLRSGSSLGPGPGMRKRGMVSTNFKYTNFWNI